MWAILIVTLPTHPNAVRLRIWRSLKSLGCAALRDGAYLLPSDHAATLDAIAAEVREHGGSASVLALAARDEVQRREVLLQFDRSASYAQWQLTAKAVHKELDRLAEAEARRRLRGVADALQNLQRIDYYPGAAAQQAQTEMQALRSALDARFSRGEPRPRAGAGLAQLDRARFQGRRWATRARPWVDRLACAWLIRRFIDGQAEFVWLPEAAQPIRTPRGALGFDYDGARFTHVGGRVTFEVLAASFGIEGDARLQRIAGAVHYLDVGGIPVAEAAGLESVLAGLRAMHADDDALLGAAAAVFDALYACPADASGESA
ncbi:MAG: chromate resistance protein ChrB domain-containing protein [Burkholderiaceae bacterium]